MDRVCQESLKSAYSAALLLFDMQFIHIRFETLKSLISSCSEGMTVLSYPCCVDPLYLNLFHISIPLTITDESMSTIWDLLGLVEIQAKLTEDLNNGLSCDKDEEELKRYAIEFDSILETCICDWV